MRIIIFLALFCSSYLTWGQSNNFFRNALVGISVSYDNNQLRLTQHSSSQRNFGVASKGGFSLGLAGCFPVTPNWEIQLQPYFSFKSTSISHFEQVNARYIYSNNNYNLVETSIPLSIAYRKQNANKRQTFLASLGGGWGYWIQSENVRRDYNLVLKNHRYFALASLGIELPTKYFTMRPEIVYQLGLNNMIKTQTDLIAQKIERINADNITVRFAFLGPVLKKRN